MYYDHDTQIILEALAGYMMKAISEEDKKEIGRVYAKIKTKKKIVIENEKNQFNIERS